MLVCVTTATAQQSPGLTLRPGEVRPMLFGFALGCMDCAPGEGARGRGRGGAPPVLSYQRPPHVLAVAPGSAAEQAGIRAGDILQSIDGVSVLTQAGAQRLASAATGDQVHLVFDRDGKPFAVALVLGQPTGTKGGPTKIINGYLALQGSARGDLSIEVWSDDPIIMRDSTDTFVLRIGTGTLIKMRLERSPADTSGANGRGSSAKKP